MSDADREMVDRWWQTFVATGQLPKELALVQQRLVRAVHRGSLPSGDVYVKVMAFPRGKDRLRYAVRALPARHEAAMLRATAAAGIPCPEVIAVRTARRWSLPFRSMLVLRALPAAPGDVAPRASLRDEAAIAARLLAAGIVHPDLHGDNFVPLRDGRLAVIDMQSARRCRASRRHRFACAVKLLQHRAATTAEANDALLGSGLLDRAGDVDLARRRAADAQRHFVQKRILRCLSESTEFSRQLRWWGVEHRIRGELPGGRWLRGRKVDLRRAWLGQRALQVVEQRVPVFPAFARNWWWLGGGAALYVPASCSDARIESEVQAATAGHALFRPLHVPVTSERPD